MEILYSILVVEVKRRTKVLWNVCDTLEEYLRTVEFLTRVIDMGFSMFVKFLMDVFRFIWVTY